MDPLTLIDLAPAAQGLSFAYILYRRQCEKRLRRLRILLLLALTVVLTGALLAFGGDHRPMPHLLRLEDPLLLLVGPLLFFLVHVATTARMPHRSALHLVPFMGYALAMIIFYALSDAGKAAVMGVPMFSDRTSAAAATLVALRTSHMLFYSVFSLMLIRRFHITLRDRYSNVEVRDLPWLLRFLWTYLGVAVAAIGLDVVSIFLHIDYLVVNAILSLIFGACLFALVYAKWRLAPMTDEPAADPASAEETQGGSVRKLHAMPDDLYRELVTRLEQTLEKDKAYLENDLNRAQLSERMGASPHHVSEVINRHYRSNFFDVVNRLRVEEVKRKLKDPKQAAYSILGIAMGSGFNTKSSFNSAFRKHTGTTPSEFRDAA